MGCHQWLWSCVQLNEYSWACCIPEKKCCGAQPGESGQNSPAQVAKFLTHSNLTFQTTSPAFALLSASVTGCTGPYPMPQYLGSHLWLLHLIGSYYPCHWNLPPQGLGVHHAISHYDSDTLAAAVHLNVSILYCQTLGQWSLISMQGLGNHIQPHTCECSLHPCMHDSGWKGINHLTVLGGNYFIIFHRVQYLSGDLVIPYHGSSLPYCQEIGYSGIDPRGCQGIYLSLPYHIHDAAYCGGSEDHRDPCHGVGQIQDFQGYLILIITLDSVHLNSYDDIAHRSGKHVSQAYTGDPSVYEVWDGPHV